jgi:hypothetical protein
MSAFVRLCNIGLRGLTLATKFALLLVLAIYLDPADVGIYGLFTASLGWLVYLVGWDFYAFSVREIAGSGKDLLSASIANQAALYFATYIPIVIFIMLAYEYEAKYTEYALVFIALFVCEHLGLELGRIFVAIGRPLLASFILFLRGASRSWQSWLWRRPIVNSTSSCGFGSAARHLPFSWDAWRCID